MPIYDYRCKECSTTYDVFHKVREIEEDVVCPACGSTGHIRLLSAPNVSTGSSTGGFNYSDAPSCETPGGCCGGGSCGIN
ncbi:MAG: zinc ribbon domain-containing protein [Bacteroidetes bacterium]|nr:zinc ribbon domain-containing protein [Bacteroidota bacterium]MCW5894955.1 zinc ribbon domain-containing protein [Bacteroidota bacterium]